MEVCKLIYGSILETCCRTSPRIRTRHLYTSIYIYYIVILLAKRNELKPNVMNNMRKFNNTKKNVILLCI